MLSITKVRLNNNHTCAFWQAPSKKIVFHSLPFCLVLLKENNTYWSERCVYLALTRGQTINSTMNCWIVLYTASPLQAGTSWGGIWGLRIEDWGLRTEDSLFTSYAWPHFHPFRPQKSSKILIKWKNPQSPVCRITQLVPPWPSEQSIHTIQLLMFQFCRMVKGQKVWFGLMSM